MNEKILSDILAEVRMMSDTQDSSFKDLTRRLDAIDRASDIPLTPKQAATYLGVSKQTISNYVKRGWITRKVRNGLTGYLRIDLEEVKRRKR